MVETEVKRHGYMRVRDVIFTSFVMSRDKIQNIRQNKPSVSIFRIHPIQIWDNGLDIEIHSGRFPTRNKQLNNCLAANCAIATRCAFVFFVLRA